MRAIRPCRLGQMANAGIATGCMVLRSARWPGDPCTLVDFQREAFPFNRDAVRYFVRWLIQEWFSLDLCNYGTRTHYT